MDRITSSGTINNGGPRKESRDAAAGTRPGMRLGMVGWLLVAALGLANAAMADGITVLKSFQGDASDGRRCDASFISDGTGNLYGTTSAGGALDKGTVFKVRTDGTGFAVLHSFAGGASDGDSPGASLTLDAAGNLYGTTYSGGASDMGTVFKIKTNGTGFALLHSFAGGTTDGAYSYSSLVLDGAGNLYGTTYVGGEHNAGTVFKIKTDGTGFALLHGFAEGPSDGARPEAGVILDGAGSLYGTTLQGGTSNFGTVFKVKIDGTGFVLLHSFALGASDDGANPAAGVILDGAGNLYGTTYGGGVSGGGTIFKVRTDGTGFALVHSFAWVASNGAQPYAPLILDGAGNLYGTTAEGSATGGGTVFKVRTDGTGFALLHGFAGGTSDGANVHTGVILDGAGNLYGTTEQGGTTGGGTVFKVKTDGTGFALLHSFAWIASGGTYPYAPLILDVAGNLYGTTETGGASDNGAIFKVKKDGTGFAVLHDFAGGASDGARPRAGVILDGAGNLYGTTRLAGAGSRGTVFKVKTDGTGFTVLHSFAGGASDGAEPYAPLILDSAGNLYGTTYRGGALDGGTMFKVRTDGTGFALLHGFASDASDGATPNAGLALGGAADLYGTTTGGGASNRGTVFKIGTDGTGFAVLHSFAGGASDGAQPYASLILDGAGTLYGTTTQGGVSNMGTVFKVKTDGTGFASLHTFAGGDSDGIAPQASLTLDGAGNLYGTTTAGGASNLGTIFKVRTDGTGFVLLHGFTGAGSDGAAPLASLILDESGKLYGTTATGGAGDLGTVFALSITGSDLTITTTSPLPPGTVGAAYAQQFSAAGGAGGYAWSLTGGAAPWGVNLSSAGLLAGTPTASGDFSFTVTVTDNASNTAQGTFTMHVAGSGCASPSITGQPHGQRIPSGRAATLTVSAGGTSPLSYQWYQGTSGDTSQPAGSNSVSFTTPALTATTSFWVRVSNGCGHADTVTATVTVGPSYANVLWIPVVVHTPGVNQSNWRSDLALLNPGTVTAHARLYFYGSSFLAGDTTSVAAGAQTIIVDVVEQLEATGQGALEVSSDQPLKVTSRTYNQVPSGASCYPNGTQGQDYPALTASEGLSAGQSAWLPHLTENAAYRTNIALVNLGPATAMVTVSLYDGAGAALASYTVILGSGAWQQEGRPFRTKAGQTAMDGGYAKATVTSGTGVFAFASVVDNTTADPTTIPMQW
jgi:uncharacterized repeat protein (TIGR03803 family)